MSASAIFDMIDNDDDITEIMQYLRDHKVDPAICNMAGDPLINYAIRSRKHEVALVLLNANVDINTPGEWGQTVLHCAASVNAIDLLPVILKHKPAFESVDDAGMTPLLMAARSGNDGFARQLIAAGAFYDINSAAALGDASRIKELIRTNENAILSARFPSDILPDSVYANSLESVRVLAFHPDVDVNAFKLSGEPPLVAAVSSSMIDIEIVRTLLDAGADPTRSATSGVLD